MAEGEAVMPLFYFTYTARSTADVNAFVFFFCHLS